MNLALEYRSLAADDPTKAAAVQILDAAAKEFAAVSMGSNKGRRRLAGDCSDHEGGHEHGEFSAGSTMILADPSGVDSVASALPKGSPVVHSPALSQGHTRRLSGSSGVSSACVPDPKLFGDSVPSVPSPLGASGEPSSSFFVHRGVGVETRG